MQSYISVLAHTKVPLVDKKWIQLPKDLKEQIWEAVQMAYVVGEWSKKMVLSSDAKKWKDFKSTLTRQFILPFANEKEKLKEPHQLYNFIEELQWDAFVASRLSPDFEAVHSEQSQRRKKCEYNHRLSRKGMLVWMTNWKKPCPMKKSILLYYGRRQEKINSEASLIQRLQRRQN
ncbi:hypothetical protein L3X38_002523 [Prunus dulcis]|uniref:Uncharacterized protein n=1 Tax=Prunus dulcis TaxID=3755 RepID=A0AAD4WU58_PRUDU|nr:hypothetical protein L3X38_002523 [Prunus dulcis]